MKPIVLKATDITYIIYLLLYSETCVCKEHRKCTCVCKERRKDHNNMALYTGGVYIQVCNIGEMQTVLRII